MSFKRTIFLFLLLLSFSMQGEIYSIGRLSSNKIEKVKGDTIFLRNSRTEKLDTVLHSAIKPSDVFEEPNIGRLSVTIVGYLSFFICLGFFVNFMPFAAWIKKQKPTMELSLYQVRGKFTYFNVLAWVEVMEHSLGCIFKAERRKLSLFNERAQKRNKPFSIYTTRVNEYLYMKSFGKSPRSIAFKRMKLYPRLVYVWTLLLFFAPINYAVWYWSEKTGSYSEGMKYGFFAGLIPGMFLWGVGRMILNSYLIGVGDLLIKRNGDAGYLHELMHQFTGMHGSYWAPLDWNDTSRTEISGLDGTAYTMGNINFEKTPMGGSKGSW